MNEAWLFPGEKKNNKNLALIKAEDWGEGEERGWKLDGKGGQITCPHKESWSKSKKRRTWFMS